MQIIEGQVSHFEKSKESEFRLDGRQCYFSGEPQIADGDRIKVIGKPSSTGFRAFAIRNYTTGLVFPNAMSGLKGLGIVFLLASLPGFLAFLGPESSFLIFCFLFLLLGIPFYILGKGPSDAYKKLRRTK